MGYGYGCLCRKIGIRCSCGSVSANVAFFVGKWKAGGQGSCRNGSFGIVARRGAIGQICFSRYNPASFCEFLHYHCSCPPRASSSFLFLHFDVRFVTLKAALRSSEVLVVLEFWPCYVGAGFWPFGAGSWFLLGFIIFSDGSVIRDYYLWFCWYYLMVV